jgi:S-formylglutathione hydrolase FrmB
MRRYPTLYILHGFSMDADAVRGMAQIVLGSCEELYKDGRIGDLIVVMPNSGTDMCIDSRELACGSFYRESWQIGDFQSYILKELIDTVDREFRTLRSVDRRAITGISMGGYGAFQLTMESNTDDRWPRRFGSAACHSGLLSFEYMRDMLANPPAWTVLFEDQLAEYIETVIIPALTSALSPGLDLELSYDETTGEIHCNQEVWRLWVENDPVRYLREHGTDAFENTALYMDCGLNDELGFLQHANLFSHVLDSLEIDHIYEPYVWEWTGEETLDYLLSGHWLIAFRIKESIQFHWDKWYPED